MCRAEVREDARSGPGLLGRGARAGGGRRRLLGRASSFSRGNAPRPHFEVESSFVGSFFVRRNERWGDVSSVEVVLLQKTLVRRQVGPTRARAPPSEEGGALRAREEAEHFRRLPLNRS